MSQIKFFYFPYAGASSITYNAWKEMFEPELELILIDYAGHGSRRNEPLYGSIEEASEDLYQKIKEQVSEGEEYYIGGHCLGAIVSYELYMTIRKHGEIATPKGLFLSGQGAPDKVKDDGLADMEGHALLRYLADNGIIEKNMLDEKLYQYVEEMVIKPVRSDSILCNEYVCDTSREKVDCKVCLQYGLDEQLYSPKSIERWNEFTKEPVQIYSYDGNHYYMNILTEKYIEDIKAEIQKNSMNIKA